MLQSELVTNPLFFLTPLTAPRPLSDHRYDTQQLEGIVLWVDFFLGLLRYNRLPSMGCQVAGDSKGPLRDTYLCFLNPGFEVFHQSHPTDELLQECLETSQYDFHPSSVRKLVRTFLVYHSLTLDEFTKRKQKMSVKINFLLTFRIIQ